MNTKTEQLIGRALDKAVPETWTTLSPNQLDKFSKKLTELIVLHCVNICFDHEGSARGVGLELLNEFGIKK